MLSAVEPTRTGKPESNQVDVSEVFASAFLFAAGTSRGLDAKVGHFCSFALLQLTSCVLCWNKSTPFFGKLRLS